MRTGTSGTGRPALTIVGHAGAANASKWNSHGAGGEKLGRAGNGDSNGAAAGGDWRGARIDSEPRARTCDCDAALGCVGVRSVDAGERADRAVNHRAGGMLAAGAARGAGGSVGGAAVRVNHGPQDKAGPG